MNKIYLFIIVLFLVGANGCSKDDGAGMPDLEVGAVASVFKDVSTLLNLPPGELGNMDVKFDVEVKSEMDVARVVVVASLNNGEAEGVYTVVNSKNAKVDVTLAGILETFPDIAEADLAPGSKLSFFISEIELIDGRVFKRTEEFEIINEDGEVDTFSPRTLSSDFTIPSSVFNTQIDYYVACEFDPSLTYGSYLAVSDDWAVEGDVTIVPDENDPYLVYVRGLAALDGLVEDNEQGLPMHIDPNSFEVTADKTILASETPWGYVDFNYSGTGIFLTCDGTYKMFFSPGVSIGGWGPQEFTLTRD
jgi:acetyltransferase-like isoleucine patch superfamily enzyme